MADQRITQLPEKTFAESTDYFVIVDKSGTPTTKKITEANLLSSHLFTWKGQWLTSTAYSVNDCVQSNGSGYVCIKAHTSGTFSTDLANADWSLLVQGV